VISGRWRAVWAVLAAVVLYVVLALLDFEPNPVRLPLLVLVCLAATALFVDAFGGDEQGWDVVPVKWAPQPGLDHGFASYLRVLEGHLTVDVPDAVLRDRLAGLARMRLDQRHGLTFTDPRADDLLGPELIAVLTGPPRRLSRAEIDQCVRRIEEL
jgi:hypothetical protein